MIPQLGDILIDAKLLTDEQLQTALDYQKKTGMRLGEVLGKLEFVKEDAILDCLATQQRLEIIDLKTIVIPCSLVKKIPIQLIEKYNIVPIGIKGDRLTIATSDPTDYEAIEHVQLLTDLKVDVVLATASEIKNVINEVFKGPDKRVKEKNDILQELSGSSSPGGQESKKRKNVEDVLNHPLTKLLIEKNIITEEEVIQKVEE
jgi:hypothetical protein